jgi:hypothetical protein
LEQVQGVDRVIESVAPEFKVESEILQRLGTGDLQILSGDPADGPLGRAEKHGFILPFQVPDREMRLNKNRDLRQSLGFKAICRFARFGK